ncbi:hypothetical protein D0Z70_23085 [Sphingobium terrigena]|uniref:Uncharacterized protein n=1 Tax=Sphingobium terrigena TaxID=2304063 RepID=A0A418YL42_9SPHN|nr:hypothetical protein [Sphingobium terrigena]RJG51683.1 hypothetical protein D0Z70_23085 [Sphingobium terrigena]
MPIPIRQNVAAGVEIDEWTGMARSVADSVPRQARRSRDTRLPTRDRAPNSDHTPALRNALRL